MSVTITHVTLDHRYFMRRTKREIIARIEEMQGRKFDFSELHHMIDWPKDRLANEAMRLVRQLPPPPDPAEQLVPVIVAELQRQADSIGQSPYADTRVPDHSKLDGFFNLRELAHAIVKSGVLSL